MGLHAFGSAKKNSENLGVENVTSHLLLNAHLLKYHSKTTSLTLNKVQTLLKETTDSKKDQIH